MSLYLKPSNLPIYCCGVDVGVFIAYRIAGNFRWVLIFAISRTVYGVAKIKTAIIYSNRNSKVGSFEIAKIKIIKIISHTFTFKSRKFSFVKFSRYTVQGNLNRAIVVIRYYESTCVSANDEESNQTGEWSRDDTGNTSYSQDNSWMMDQSQYTGGC